MRPGPYTISKGIPLVPLGGSVWLRYSPAGLVGPQLCCSALLAHRPYQTLALISSDLRGHLCYFAGCSGPVGSSVGLCKWELRRLSYLGLGLGWVVPIIVSASGSSRSCAYCAQAAWSGHCSRSLWGSLLLCVSPTVVHGSGSSEGYDCLFEVARPGHYSRSLWGSLLLYHWATVRPGYGTWAVGSSGAAGASRPAGHIKR